MRPPSFSYPCSDFTGNPSHALSRPNHSRATAMASAESRHQRPASKPSSGVSDDCLRMLPDKLPPQKLDAPRVVTRRYQNDTIASDPIETSRNRPHLFGRINISFG